MSSSADKAVMWLGPPLIAAVTILYAIAALWLCVNVLDPFDGGKHC